MWRDKRGSIAVEFALIGSMLVLLLMAATDLSLAINARTQVGNAARAGAEYAAANGWNSSAISTAVTSATSLAGVTATPAPSNLLWLRHRRKQHRSAGVRNGVRGGGQYRHLCNRDGQRNM